jgi:hypothetical protein
LESVDYFNTFKHYAHYREILEAIGDIRDPNVPYEHNELWDAFRWRKADLDELAWLIRKEELGLVSRALFEKLRANIKDNYDTQKHKELALLEEKLGKGYLREPNMMLFHKLKQEADTGANMEALLGELITAQVFDANTNALLVEYFYLKGNVAAYGVYALYFYINYASQKNNPLKDTTDSMLPEMGKKIVELSINATSLGTQVLTAGASQSLIDLIKRTLQADGEDLISKEEKTSLYDKFTENFLKFISYERETMSELEFNQRYPLDGFDDWRKKRKSA